MNLVIYTLGCKLNQCEGEALAAAFKNWGFTLLDFEEKADLYIINTCAVTSKAEQKARRMIQKFSNRSPESVIIITGCYAQEVRRNTDSPNPRRRIVSQDRKYLLLGLPEYLTKHSREDAPLLKKVDEFFDSILLPRGGVQPNPFAFQTSASGAHSRAYLKFQDGCDNRCAYCLTTLVRGPSVSLPWPEMRKRLINLEEVGYREIVLTGVNITSYQWEGMTFSDLLGEISAAMTGARIRLSSLEPESITEEVGEILRSPVFCPHFHIAVQSCSDTVLQRMGRRARSTEIRRAVKILRSIKDDPFIAADVIAGFPVKPNRNFRKPTILWGNCNLQHFMFFPSPPGREPKRQR